MKAERVRLVAWAAAGIAAAAFSMIPVPPRFVWNRTASLPEGLYVLAPDPVITRGMIVAYTPSANEAAFLESNRYTGRGWPLVKRVAALDGDEVCRREGSIFINGKVTVQARASDSAGRELPTWQGCRHLGPEDILLLADHPHSVDGRYFGVQDKARIAGGLRRLRWPGRKDSAPAEAHP